MLIPKLLLAFLLLIFMLPLHAQKLTLEPLYGVESALVPYPEPPRFTTRATYGGRLLYGITALSAEAEYIRAQSRRDFPASAETFADSVERASLGLRSTYPLGRYLGIFARAGGRASRGKTDITTSGITETREHPLRVDPYAGAGLQLAISHYIALNAGTTLFRVSDNRYETQYTLGLSLRLGNL